MTDDQRSPIIKPAVDASAVRPGFEEVKQAARETAQVVGSEADKAGRGLDGIGEGAKKGADKTERAAKSITAALQRVTAEIESGGRNTPEYFEKRIGQLGLNAEQFRPYIDGLRAAQSAQLAASKGLGTMEISARQTAAALRQVPAQFTDIFTSLAGGQAPLTVLLQQGGQLKDVFGGAVPAARALGGYVAGLITPTTLLAGAVVALGAGYVLGSKEAQGYSAALIQTGNAAGTSVDRLADMARAIRDLTGATQGRAAEVLTQIAAAGDVGATNLQRFARAAIEFERAGGPAAEKTAEAFSALAKSPLEASIRLNESTRYLSGSVAEQIALLERQGRTVEAARLAQDAYADALEDRAPQMLERLGLIDRAWLDIVDSIKRAANQIKSIGRPDTLSEQISALEEQVALARRLREGSGTGLLALLGSTLETSARDQIESLREQIRLLQRAATARGEQVAQDQARIEWIKQGNQYLTEQQKLEAEVVRIRELGRQAGLSELEIAARLKDLVQKTYGSKSATAEAADERERQRALKEQAQLLEQLSGLSGTYAQDLAVLDSVRRQGIISEERYGELVRELVDKQPVIQQAARERAKAAQEEARGIARAQKAYDDYIKSLDRLTDTQDREILRLRDEYIELTAGKKVRQEVAAADAERLAITYDQAAAVAALNGQEQAYYQRLAERERERARLLRATAAAVDQDEVRKANERASKDAARDWKRAADQISRDLTDAIFDGGKDAGDLLKSYFKSLILEPYIKAQVEPIVGAIGKTLGIPGSSGASTAALPDWAKSIGDSQIAQTIGSYAKAVTPYLQAYAFGRSIGQRLGGGYSLNGGSGNSTINTGAAIGSIFGPVGTLVGSAIGGAVNRLFGRKLKDFGIEGNFGAGGDFSGQQYEFLKGGLFRSNKTRRSELDEQLGAVLDAGGLAAYEQAKAYADALGLPVRAIEGFSSAVKVSLKGLSEQEAQAAIEKSIADYQEALLGQYKSQLEPLQRAGESLAQTAQRLSILQTVSRDLNELGGVFSAVAGLSVDAREELAKLAGGLENLTQQAQGYVQEYYSREEIAGLKARDLQQVFEGLGVGGAISTRDQFRGLVDSTDVSTAAGREQLAQLLAISGDFAQVADYLAEVGLSLQEAAAFAPEKTPFADLFTQPAQAQVDAIDRVNDGVSQTNGLLQQLIDVVRSARPALPDRWEVARP